MAGASIIPTEILALLSRFQKAGGDVPKDGATRAARLQPNHQRNVGTRRFAALIARCESRLQILQTRGCSVLCPNPLGRPPRGCHQIVRAVRRSHGHKCHYECLAFGTRRLSDTVKTDPITMRDSLSITVCSPKGDRESVPTLSNNDSVHASHSQIICAIGTDPFAGLRSKLCTYMRESGA